MTPPAPVVLVVEDEVLIRMDVVDQLGAQGCIPLEACNAREALETLGSADRIDLLITDVDMPGDLDGLMLAREVARCWPWIGIIVTSGNSPIDADQLPDRSRFFSKPCEAATIRKAINELLSRVR